MSEDNKADELDEAAFTERVRELLEAEADSLNAPVQSKLNQARQAALDELPDVRKESSVKKVGPFVFGGLNFAPVSAFLLLAGIVITLMLFEPEFEETISGQVSVAENFLTPEDFNMLISDDSMEMFTDLDFYAWLDEELVQDEDTSG